VNQLQPKSVVVGVDGSKAALNAAKWAVDEAISPQIPLRLVSVVGRSKAQSASAQPSDWELEGGETALDQADVAVQDVGESVEVETVLLRMNRRMQPWFVSAPTSEDGQLTSCWAQPRPRWRRRTLPGSNHPNQS
jgi:hypothetical protein